MGCGNVELKPCSPSLGIESLNMTRNTLQLVVGVDKCVCTKLQDLVKIWEPSRVPPQRYATQEHLEMLPIHIKPAGCTPQYWVVFFN